MDGGAWCRLLPMGLQRVGHNWATSLSFFLYNSTTISKICERAKFYIKCLQYILLQHQSFDKQKPTAGLEIIVNRWWAKKEKWGLWKTNTNLSGGSFLPLNIPWLETSHITSLHLTEQESQGYKNYKWKQNSVESTQPQSTAFLTKLVQLPAVTSPSLRPPQDRTHPAVPGPGPDLEFPSCGLNQWWPRWEAKFISAKKALPLLRRSLIGWVPGRSPQSRGPYAWSPLMLSCWWHNSWQVLAPLNRRPGWHQWWRIHLPMQEL